MIVSYVNHFACLCKSALWDDLCSRWSRTIKTTTSDFKLSGYKSPYFINNQYMWKLSHHNGNLVHSFLVILVVFIIKHSYKKVEFWLFKIYQYWKFYRQINMADMVLIFRSSRLGSPRGHVTPWRNQTGPDHIFRGIQGAVVKSYGF